MTLSAFRAERFPDQSTSPNAFAKCSDEVELTDFKYADSVLFGEMKEIGIVKCHFYYISPISNREDNAHLLAAEWGTLTDFYFVRPEGADDFFLYEIISKSKQPIFSELLEAYEVAMESPPVISTTAVQNGFGAKFENIVASWENDVSRLRLEKYYSDLETLAIVVTLTSLNDLVDERLKRVVEQRAEKL